MQFFAAASVVGLLLISPVAAQDRLGSGNQSGKELLAQCRTAALAEGLDAGARRQAIAACILKASPVVTARIHCLMGLRRKDMDSKTRLAFIKGCVQGNK